MHQVGKDIQLAREFLEKGELVAIPTETVYGLAGNAINPDAVAKIFSVKNRPYFDPLIVHVASLEQAQNLVTEFPEPALHLAQAFWPGPLTLLLRKKNIIPDLVTAGLDTVALRIPRHELTLSLLDILPFPLAAPSANPFGYISPTCVSHVEEQLGKKIPYILEGGPCHIGLESTIIGFEGNKPLVYRLGGISLEEIEGHCGPVKMVNSTGEKASSPGQLTSHYAPRKKLILGDLHQLMAEYPAHCTGFLSFREDLHSPFQKILSPEGNLEEAAKNLFSSLRALDKMPIQVILGELVPDIGLGKAINDRLKRASA